MRLGWAIVLGVVVGALVVWWLGRSERGRTDDDAAIAIDHDGEVPENRRGNATPVLYRWRDDAGVLQVTDTPPRDRAYDTVDVDGLQRRNTFDPRTDAPAATQ